MHHDLPTFAVTIYMAGDIETAKRWLRTEVTVTPTTFIYTGGEESGFAVGLVNYPRFPANQSDVWNRALVLANALIVECCQKTALVVGPDMTTWISTEPPGARP